MTTIDTNFEKKDGRLNRRQLSMLDPEFDRLHLRLFKSTSTKLGHFQIIKFFMTTTCIELPEGPE